MERILSVVEVGNQVAGESLIGTIKIAVLPIAKVFTVCSLGLLMASKYVNILPAHGRKLLNGLVFSLLLPCLIFTQLGQAITLEKMLEWWFIPANVVIGSISGSIIGFITASIIHPPYPYFKLTVIQIGIGNIGNVPLVLIAALCRDSSNPFGDSCSTNGTAYISFGQWVGAIILYTYVFNMLAPPPEGYDNDDETLPIKSPRDGKTPAQVPLLSQEDKEEEEEQTHEQENGKTPAQVPSLLSQEDEEEEEEQTHEQEVVEINPNTSKISKITEVLIFLYEKLKLKQLCEPPIIASVLAMVLGCIPFLKKQIFTSTGPLFFFTDSCTILGDAMIPCILLALGGNLINGPGSSKLGFRTTAAIVFARLVLVPPVGLGIVTLADKLGFLPADDKMFRFVLLLQHTMPSSILAGAVANLRGCGREAAGVLFWVHIFAVFSMAGWIILYLNILF